MRFLQLPNDAKRVTAIAFNNAKDLIAVAVEMWDFDEFHSHQLAVMFF